MVCPVESEWQGDPWRDQRVAPWEVCWDQVCCAARGEVFMDQRRRERGRSQWEPPLGMDAPQDNPVTLSVAVRTH